MEVTLSKNSWHFRLQEFVLGGVFYQKNFCPYFWLTIFSIFASPWVAVYVLLKKPVLFIAGHISNFLDTLDDITQVKICEPIKKRALESVTPEQAFLLYEAFKYRESNGYVWSTGSEALLEKFWRWRAYISQVKDNDTTWLEIVREGEKSMEKIRERDQEKLQARMEAEKIRKERIKRIHLTLVKVTKVFFYTLISIAATGLAALLVSGLWLLWTVKGAIWTAIVNYGPITLLIVLGVMALVALVIGVAHGLKCLSSLNYPKVEKKERKWLSNIKGFFSFFWIFIVNFKKNHCPHIEWTED